MVALFCIGAMLYLLGANGVDLVCNTPDAVLDRCFVTIWYEAQLPMPGILLMSLAVCGGVVKFWRKKHNTSVSTI